MGINIPRSLFEFDYLDLDRMLKLKLEREEQGLDQEDLIYDKLTGLKTEYLRNRSETSSLISEEDISSEEELHDD